MKPSESVAFQHAHATQSAKIVPGDSTLGQLRTGDTTDQIVPTKVAGGLTCTALSVGASHRCTKADSGDTYCWGDNFNGQMGRGTQGIAKQTTPLPVVGNQTFSRFADASMTSEFTLALSLGHAFGDQVPTAPMQQFARDEAASCDKQPDDLVDFPALGALTHVNWGPSWAQWPNDGTGGFVCTRQPYYTNIDTWAVR